MCGKIIDNKQMKEQIHEVKDMFKWKDYEENAALFIDGINENVAILRYKDLQLTDSSTGLKVKMKSSNIDEAKVDAENFLKELWFRVERNYKRNLDALK